MCVFQEEEVVSVLNSALQQCLVLGSRDHHEWNTQLLDELIERSDHLNTRHISAFYSFDSMVSYFHYYSSSLEVSSMFFLCRASMEGPLWCQVLKQFISALETSLNEEDRFTVLPDFIRSASYLPS